MPDTWLMLVWTLFFLVVVLGLAYCFTRYVAGRGGLGLPGGGTDGIRVLERLALGKEQQLLLVQTGERYFLLGAAPSGITLLSELTPEEARSCHMQRGQAGGRMGFSEALRGAVEERRSGVKK